MSFGAGTNLGIQVTDAARLTITNPITGPQGLVKFGAGTLAFAGTSTYTGRTTIAAGTVLLRPPPPTRNCSGGQQRELDERHGHNADQRLHHSASGSLPEALVVEVDDRIASATAPTVTYNGVR